nr:hypothetical protein [uncultured Desulfobulbus sp.]
MKSAVLVGVFCLGFAAWSCATSNQATHSAKAVQESGAASVHANGSAAHVLVGSGQVTSAVSAVPMAASGASLTTVGKGSTSAATSLEKAASAPVQELPLTKESLITVPPDQALAKP